MTMGVIWVDTAALVQKMAVAIATFSPVKSLARIKHVYTVTGITSGFNWRDLTADHPRSCPLPRKNKTKLNPRLHCSILLLCP